MQMTDLNQTEPPYKAVDKTRILIGDSRNLSISNKLNITTISVPVSQGRGAQAQEAIGV